MRTTWEAHYSRIVLIPDSFFCFVIAVPRIRGVQEPTPSSSYPLFLCVYGVQFHSISSAAGKEGWFLACYGGPLEENQVQSEEAILTDRSCHVQMERPPLAYKWPTWRTLSRHASPSSVSPPSFSPPTPNKVIRTVGGCGYLLL